jgi:uncharacterized protein YecE (DUF72 family)
MNYLTVRFPQRRENTDETRDQILKLLTKGRFGVRVILKPKHKDKHWWDIGTVVETDLLNLIRYNQKTVYVYNDKTCKQLYCKLYCNWRGELQTDYLDKQFYESYNFDDQELVTKLYRLILGVPYHYLIFKN